MQSFISPANLLLVDKNCNLKKKVGSGVPGNSNTGKNSNDGQKTTGRATPHKKCERKKEEATAQAQHTVHSHHSDQKACSIKFRD